MASSEFRGVRWTDDDILNPGEYIDNAQSTRPGVRPWLLHDHGFVLCVVFAPNEQEALELAVDAGKLDRFRVSGADGDGYGPEGAGLAYLGNASEPYDLEGLGVEEMPNPTFSFAALCNWHERCRRAERVGLRADAPDWILEDAERDAGLRN